MLKPLGMDDDLEPDYHGMVGILPHTDTHHEETHPHPILPAPEGEQGSACDHLPPPWGNCP